MNLATTEHGNGRPTVLLHGLASTGLTWSRVAPALPGRTIAVDLRGHGHSPRGGPFGLPQLADDVVAILDELGEPTDLIGHSLGGYLAVIAAERRPSLVRRLVLEDPAVPPENDTGARIGRTPGGFASIFVLTRMRQFNVTMAQPVITQLREYDPVWWNDLGRIKASSLVIRGDRATNVPSASVDELANRLGARLVVVPGAGHRIHSLHPDAFLAEVAPFLT